MRTILTFILFFVFLTLNTAAKAADIIDKIIIKDNQRIESSTIESYIDIKAGDVFDQKKVNESLKKMFATGLFSDVSVARSGSSVVITVVENPIINKVSFEGNKRINDDTLSSEVELQSRSVYTRAKVQQDTKKIQDAYRKSGRFSVDVEPKIVKLDQNRVDLIFEINEGKKTTISKIYFVGNKRFDDDKLKKAINTNESRWYSFYSGNDTYDPDRVSFDKELLRKFYVSRGYADFKVLSSTAEITKDKKSFVLTFTVEEGEKYNFGKMKVTSSLQSIQVDNLYEEVKSKEGELFNATLVDDTVDGITGKLNDMGYAFVDINPKYDRDETNRIMGVTYQISEGPKVYIDKINITGNVRTLDKVVRRELRIAEGDPYNAAKIRRSQQNIQNLGFFDKVELDSKRSDEAQDKANIELKVKEKSTGELSFGAGFSTNDGALGNVSIREKNLLGKGQDLRLSLQKSQNNLTSSLSFTEPYFMDKNISSGFDLWNTSSSREDYAASSIDSYGLALRGSYSITEYLRHTIKYIIKQDNVTNIRSDASTLVKSQEGSTMASIIGQSLMYDKRDNRFEPTSGYFILLDENIAGIGGDVNYIRHEITTGYYRPVYGEDFILRLTAAGGYVSGYGGKDVRFADNFRLTGRQIRGFENIGFGPTDFTENAEGTVLGGKRYYAQTTELGIPLSFLPDELGFKSYIFHDLGSITGLDAPDNPLIIDKDTLHASYGLGLSWTSPLGPLNVSYAVPYLKDSFDRTQRLQFDFGTRF